MRKHRFHKFYRIFLSISIILAAASAMAACGILFLSDGGFSRDAVIRYSRAIAFPLFLCLGLIALGAFPGLRQHPEKLRNKAVRQEYLVLRRLRSRVALSGCEDFLQSSIAKERRLQRTRNGISAALSGAILGILLVYLLTGDRFPREDPNASIFGLLCILFPGLLILLGWTLFSRQKYIQSIHREIDFLKSAPVSATAAGETARRPLLPAFQIFLLVAAVLLCIAGLLTGGAEDVLTKAVNICTECIGLG